MHEYFLGLPCRLERAFVTCANDCERIDSGSVASRIAAYAWLQIWYSPLVSKFSGRAGSLHEPILSRNRGNQACRPRAAINGRCVFVFSPSRAKIRSSFGTGGIAGVGALAIAVFGDGR